VLNGSPHYLLTPTPLAAHGCRVMQTNNGKRLDDGKTFATRTKPFRAV
jgi:hypothetical protein